MVSNAGQQSSQQRAKKFISENVRAEYEYLISCLKECVDERNANRGDLPEFVLRGSSIVELGHTALYLKFGQQYSNPDLYLLNLTVGWAPFRENPLFGTAPTAQTREFEAAASADLRSIRWLDKKNLRPLTSAEVVEFALDWLTFYYQQHTPN
jgi:hypothetical protein